MPKSVLRPRWGALVIRLESELKRLLIRDVKVENGLTGGGSGFQFALICRTFGLSRGAIAGPPAIWSCLLAGWTSVAADFC